MTPVWRKEGWAPGGPGRCVCPACGEKVSTNALARASHTKQCALRRRNERITRCPRMIGGVHLLALGEGRCRCGFMPGMDGLRLGNDTPSEKNDAPS